MKKACVFGGSGFLGSHVADELSANGYNVVVFDAVESKWLSNGQEMMVGSVLDREAVRGAIVGADVVYNFAAIADLNDGYRKPLETIEINVLGNANIMSACCEQQVDRFVFASSVYVHSQSGGFYRCSKQASEKYVEEYQRLLGLNYTILRYGSLYGHRADASNGLYRLVSRAIKDRQLSYEGDPETVREYIHVKDAAKSSVEILADEYRNASILLTGAQQTRMDDLLKMLREMLSLKTDLQFSGKAAAGHYVRTPYTFQPDLSRKFIGNSYVDFGEGLLKLVEEIAFEEKDRDCRSSE